MTELAQETLAILGGAPYISDPHPHFLWPPRLEDVATSLIKEYYEGKLSYTGKEGPIQGLEDRFASYHNSPFAISTSSGTMALYSAFVGLGLKPGDDVLVPVYTYHATVTPLLHLGVRPVFCDADPRNGNIDPEQLPKRVTRKTRAIVITHMWGHPCEMDAITYWAKRLGLPIVEDCSHAHGARYKGRLVGTFGTVACWSLQGAKILPVGEGGILLTGDRDVYERATLLGHWGNRAENEVRDPYYARFARTGMGLKLRMHPLAAAIGLRTMDFFGSWISEKSALLTKFSEELAKIEGILPPNNEPYVSRGGWYEFLCQVHPSLLHNVSLNSFVEALKAEGVETKVTRVQPLNRLPLFSAEEGLQKLIPQAPRSLDLASAYPGADSYVENRIHLPAFTFKKDQTLVYKYVGAINKVVAQIKQLSTAAVEQHD